jgi:hypothetical protein
VAHFVSSIRRLNSTKALVLFPQAQELSSYVSTTPSAIRYHHRTAEACDRTGEAAMMMTNDTYCVVIRGKKTTERYYRDAASWLKVSSRGRVFRATAEQVLNHLLPALAFSDRLGLKVEVQHYDVPYWETLEDHRTPSDSN